MEDKNKNETKSDKKYTYMVHREEQIVVVCLSMVYAMVDTQYSFVVLLD